MSAFDIPNYSLKPDQIEKMGSYSLIDAEKVRKQILEDLYKSQAQTVIEIQTKRKCGILGPDVYDYYMGTNKRQHLIDFPNIDEALTYYDAELEDVSSELEENDKLDSSQNNGLKIDDEVQPSYSDSDDENEDESQKGKPLPIFSDDDLVKKFNEPKILSFDMADSTDVNDVTKICKDLNLFHACEKKFCPRNLNSINDKYSDGATNTSLVYACDYCQLVLSIRERMVNHLNDYNHYSASEYIVERNEHESKIKYIKSRSSLKNFNVDNSIGVFCPQCNFCFTSGVLACATHYKYVHNPFGNEYLYALSERKRVDEFEVDKAHSCFDCGQKFKKLTDLVAHLDNSKHFPYAKQNEINVFNCPFDSCKFISINFFTFKTHILSHPFFNRPAQSDQLSDMRVLIKINVYPVPNSFFHVTKFSTEDQKEEVNAIDCLLDSVKGHNDYNELSKIIRARKDQLHKSFRKNSDS